MDNLEEIPVAAGFKRFDNRVIQAPLPLRVTPSEGDDGPEIEALFDVIDGRLQCRSVTLRAAEHGREISPTDLDVEALRRAAAEFSMPLSAASDSGTVRLDIRADEDDRYRARRALDRSGGAYNLDRLKRVAEVYMADTSGAPTEAVRKHFNVAHRTAGVYVQKARKAGLLPPAKRAASRPADKGKRGRTRG